MEAQRASTDKEFGLYKISIEDLPEGWNPSANAILNGTKENQLKSYSKIFRLLPPLSPKFLSKDGDKNYYSIYASVEIEKQEDVYSIKCKLEKLGVQGDILGPLFEVATQAETLESANYIALRFMKAVNQI
jgi:hypothetical protein